MLQPVEVNKLIKARPLDNMEFMQWFKRYFDAQAGSDLSYDAAARRAGSKTGDVKGRCAIHMSSYWHVNVQSRLTSGRHTDLSTGCQSSVVSVWYLHRGQAELDGLAAWDVMHVALMWVSGSLLGITARCVIYLFLCGAARGCLGSFQPSHDITSESLHGDLHTTSQRSCCCNTQTTRSSVSEQSLPSSICHACQGHQSGPRGTAPNMFPSRTHSHKQDLSRIHSTS